MEKCFKDELRGKRKRMAQFEECKQNDEGKSEDTGTLESEESDLELEYEEQQLGLHGGSIPQSQTRIKTIENTGGDFGPITAQQESAVKEGVATKTIQGKIHIVGMINPEIVTLQVLGETQIKGLRRLRS